MSVEQQFTTQFRKFDVMGDGDIDIEDLETMMAKEREALASVVSCVPTLVNTGLFV